MGGVTHDTLRHGTTTRFAALDAATGSVIAECKPRQRHQEFLSFLRRVDKEVSLNLDVHLIIDNHCTHKHAKVRSSLNQVERWVGTSPSGPSGVSVSQASSQRLPQSGRS